MDFVDCFLSGVDTIKDHEGLPPCFEIGFRNYVDDNTIFRKQFSESFFQLIDFDALLKVPNIDTMRAVSSGTHVSMCNDTYVALGAGIMEVIFGPVSVVVVEY